MEKRTWQEAAEIDPDEGIFDELEAQEDALAHFPKPAIKSFDRALASKSYVDALKLFQATYDKNPELLEKEGIPWGRGDFEGWWTGSSDEANSPHNPITRVDVRQLLREDPVEAASLFSNIFYNKTITTNLEPGVIEDLVRYFFKSMEDYEELFDYFGDIKDGGLSDILEIANTAYENIQKKAPARRAFLARFRHQEAVNPDNDEDESEAPSSSLVPFPEPSYMQLDKAFASRSSYVDAIHLLQTIYENDIDLLEKFDIPLGSGAFETWWTGSRSRQPISTTASPNRSITRKDIQRLVNEDPEQIGSLFSNIFYSSAITTGLEPGVIEDIVTYIMRYGESDLLEYLDGAKVEELGPVNAALEAYRDIQAYAKQHRQQEAAINPESGYVTEDDPYTNPISGYIRDDDNPIRSPAPLMQEPEIQVPEEDIEEEGQGDVSAFEEPTAPPAVVDILKAKDYVEALTIFDEKFNEFNKGLNRDALIPWGSGAFEAWWCGKEPDPNRFPNAVASPHRKITRSDVRELLGMSDNWGPRGAPAIALFSTIFYNCSMTEEGMDKATLEYLLENVLEIAYQYDDLDEEGEVSAALATSNLDLNEAKTVMELEDDAALKAYVEKEVDKLRL